MDESKIFKSNVIKYSLIIGVIGILFSVIPYVFNENLMTKWWYGIGLIIIFFVIYLVSAFNLRSELGGFVSFKRVFLFVLLVAIFSGLIGTTFELLLFNVIDPDYSERLQRASVENAIQMMERFNTPEEVMDEQIAKMESQQMFSTTSIIKRFFTTTLIFGVIIALIIGAIVKKKKPEELAV